MPQMQVDRIAIAKKKLTSRCTPVVSGEEGASEALSVNVEVDLEGDPKVAELVEQLRDIVRAAAEKTFGEEVARLTEQQDLGLGDAA